MKKCKVAVSSEAFSASRKRSHRFLRILHKRFCSSKHRSRLPFLYREVFGEMHKGYTGYNARFYQSDISSDDAVVSAIPPVKHQRYLSVSSSSKQNETIDVDDIDGSYENSVYEPDKTPVNLSIHRRYEERKTYRRRGLRKFPSSDEESPKSPKQTPNETLPARGKNTTIVNKIDTPQEKMTENVYTPVEDEVLFIREFRKVKTKSPPCVNQSKKNDKWTERFANGVSEDIMKAPKQNNRFYRGLDDAEGGRKKIDDVRKVTVSDSNCNSSPRKEIQEKKPSDVKNSRGFFHKSSVERLKKEKEGRVESDDDDIILVKNDDTSSDYVDFSMLKKIVVCEYGRC